MQSLLSSSSRQTVSCSPEEAYINPQRIIAHSKKFPTFAKSCSVNLLS
ncbi:hypothetical protein BACCOPRO_03548 [Phocaeicola coprophilus DSM 18228 = JCM 13818]|uniref:Uncharacterized protein n=1 Tax=Phocaeicola coprophilus DSM 18228 = JCM 13818 TaxID=547042 RepID=S0FD22_9BACT|nr:hypothetical protein BACCOPRO_03548 [Phocaeicola coprophilus DSM 18228 = JCM 13818]